METVCHNQLIFKSLFSKEVVADFAGGRITSDAGGLLLRELDRRYRLAENAARRLQDPREGGKVKHDLLTLMRQRMFAIAQGYEDNNDAATLAKDPAFKIMAGKAPESARDLASQPTLSRFENQVTAKDLRRLSDWFLDLYLKTHPGPRKVIVLDMDATDDPTHGKQQLSFFHGYYEEHMYHPLLVFDGRDGFPLAAVLRPGNTHSSRGALAVLKRLIKKLKQAYPKALILFRADAGFAVPAIYRYLEEVKIRYVIGFITNNRVLAKAAPLLLKAQRQYLETGEKQRLFTSFSYQAESWAQPRRLIAKVEYTHLGSNQRFVVTNLVRNPQFVYDDIYVLRGDVENRIKELKLELKADRLSCHRFLANQFRLLLHTAAYCLFWLLRHHLQGTELATAQVNTLRLKLLKIGARIQETSRRIWVHLASGYPYRDLLALVLQNLRASPG
ncbi:MAG: IS1380 family transposase [Desulfobaccales bacterium]